ncbi:type I methionyl aminopeptidase [Humidisolicoccus flavus]|uniref:type I methionyl aminopeptidase n=1 Tax=Humidisolicoccus flavus TaxID=3111414 RepID=UPI0032522CE0
MKFSRKIYKSPAQLAAMVEPGRVTAIGLEAAVAAVRPGATTLDIDTAASDAIIAAGGQSNFKLVPGYRHTICASVNDELVHGIPGGRVLEPGDLLKIDCGAIVDGWNGDSAVSVIVPGGSGDVVEIREELSRVTRESLWHGIAALASAKYLGEVGAAIEEYVTSQGEYGIIEDFVGHGIGQNMHEDPPVFNYRTSTKGPAVKPGLCIAIEPMLVTGAIDTHTLADEWTIVTNDGGQACQWEHSVAVHSRGIWVLTAFDGGASELARFGITPVPIPPK